MKKLKILLLFSVFLVIIPLSLADFPPTHLWQNAEAFNHASGGLLNECGNRLPHLLAGNIGADMFVVHYYDERVVSYIYTHTQGAYERCLQEAGSDLDLKCMCYGIPTHLIQDYTSHYISVPENIKKVYLTNAVMHPITELGEQQTLMDYLNSDRSSYPKLAQYNTVSSAQVESYVENAFNLFRCGQVFCPSDFNYQRDGYKNKYVDLWKRFTSLNDIERDMAIVGASLAGVKFRDAAWNPKKLSLPSGYYLFFGILTAIGIALIVSAVYFGRTSGWKWIPIIIGSITLIFSVLVIASMLLGTTWLWFQSFRDVAQVFINNDNFENLVASDVEETIQFLETGILKPQFGDASGLTYDRNGVLIEGALDKAEARFVNITLPSITIIITLLLMVSYWRMLKKRKN